MTFVFPADAPALQDLLALVEIALAVMLVVGLVLVRRGHVRAHRLLQSAIILVNIPIVLYGMVPYYLENIAPSLASQWRMPYVWVPTVMLLAGAAAELLGVFIILRRGDELGAGAVPVPPLQVVDAH